MSSAPSHFYRCWYCGKELTFGDDANLFDQHLIREDGTKVCMVPAHAHCYGQAERLGLTGDKRFRLAVTRRIKFRKMLDKKFPDSPQSTIDTMQTIQDLLSRGLITTVYDGEGRTKGYRLTEEGARHVHKIDAGDFLVDFE